MIAASDKLLSCFRLFGFTTRSGIGFPSPFSMEEFKMALEVGRLLTIVICMTVFVFSLNMIFGG